MRAVEGGAGHRIAVVLLDVGRDNVSSSGRDVAPLHLERVNSGGTETQVTLADAGGSNPDDLFRYDADLGGYIFNLSTKGLTAGTYDFVWSAEGDPTEHHLSFSLI